MERFFATWPPGLELLLADELLQLQAEHAHAVSGGVQVAGDFFLCCRVYLGACTDSLTEAIDTLALKPTRQRIAVRLVALAWE